MTWCSTIVRRWKLDSQHCSRHNNIRTNTSQQYNKHFTTMQKSAFLVAVALAVVVDARLSRSLQQEEDDSSTISMGKTCTINGKDEPMSKCAVIFGPMAVIILICVCCCCFCCKGCPGKKYRDARREKAGTPTPGQPVVQKNINMPNLLTVMCPANVTPGQTIQVQTPSGPMNAVVPEGIAPGQTFIISIAPAAPI